MTSQAVVFGVMELLRMVHKMEVLILFESTTTTTTIDGHGIALCVPSLLLLALLVYP